MFKKHRWPLLTSRIPSLFERGLKRKHHQKPARYLVFTLSSALSLTLMSCLPKVATTTGISYNPCWGENPNPSLCPKPPSASPNPAEDEGGTSALEQPPLKLIIIGDASLAAIRFEEIEEDCLDDVKSLKTQLILEKALGESAQTQLENQGLEVNGNRLTIDHPINDFDALIAGFQVILPEVPRGEIQASTQLLNQAGLILGTLDYQIDTLTGDQHTVTVLLKATSEETEANACPSLIPDISGGNLLNNSGDLFAQNAVPDNVNVPTNPNMPETPEPTETTPPTSAPATALPENLSINLIYRLN